MALTDSNCPHPLPGPPHVCLMLQAPAGQPPDVAARLRRACDIDAGGSHHAGGQAEGKGDQKVGTVAALTSLLHFA